MPGFKNRAWAAGFWFLSAIMLAAGSPAVAIWLIVATLAGTGTILAAAYHLVFVAAGLAAAMAAAAAALSRAEVLRARRVREVARHAGERNGISRD